MNLFLKHKIIYTRNDIFVIARVAHIQRREKLACKILVEFSF